MITEPTAAKYDRLHLTMLIEFELDILSLHR